MSLICIFIRTTTVTFLLFSIDKECFHSAYKVTNGFKGKVFIGMGDGRQIGPVVKRGGMEETVEANIFHSRYWHQFVVFEFLENMRLTVHVPNDQWTHQQRQEYDNQVAFAANLLTIGDGKSNPENAELISADPTKGKLLLLIPVYCINLNLMVLSARNFRAEATFDSFHH